jgi:hypothetical protein
MSYVYDRGNSTPCHRDLGRNAGCVSVYRPPGARWLDLGDFVGPRGERGRPPRTALHTRDTAAAPDRSKQPPGRALARTALGPVGRRPLSFHALRSGGPGTAARCLGRVGAPLLTWAICAAPRQTGLGQPIAAKLMMACPGLRTSALNHGDGDAAGSILARSHVLVASSNKLMPSIQLRDSRRRTVLAGKRDWMSSAASP